MPEPENEPGTEPEDLGDGGKKALEAEREARKNAERQLCDAKKAAEAAAAQVKEFQDRDKTETQKAADRIAELERLLAEKDSILGKKDQDILRRDVAKDKGVPVSAVTGSTREEMEAAADALIEWRGTERKPVGALRSGASAATNSDPKERAAQALRAMWHNK